MCLVTPPGYVHEYGETRAIRILRSYRLAVPPPGVSLQQRSVRLLAPLGGSLDHALTVTACSPSYGRADPRRR